MPPPIVPAPMTPTLLTGSVGVSSGTSAIFQTCRSAKNTWRCAFDWVEPSSSMNDLRSFAQALRRRAVRPRRAPRRWRAPRPRSRGICARSPCGSPRRFRACRARARSCRRGRAPCAAAASCRSPRARRRARPRAACPPPRARSITPEACACLAADRRPRQDRLERRLRPDQARQALRAAGAGNEPELDLRQADLGRGNGDAVMADQRDLEAAAQRRAVDRGDDRLGAILDRGLRVGQARAGERLAELGDVGAGDEGAPGADQHDRLDRGIGRRLPHAVAQPVAHLRRQRVDGRRIDGQDGDVALHAEVGDGIDGGH